MVKKPNSVKYQALFVGSNAPTISGYSSGLVELNPYEQLRNIGEYYIIAQIVSGSEAILVNGISINIVPSVEEQYQLEIRADEIKGEQNELSTYYLSAKILLNGEQVNPDNLLISWYYEGATEPFRRMNSDFYWTPEEPGIYTIFARIEGIENVIIQSKTPITIAVAYNNTNAVLIGIAVAVAVAFLGVVLVTVVKVKREKVW